MTHKQRATGVVAQGRLLNMLLLPALQEVCATKDTVCLQEPQHCSSAGTSYSLYALHAFAACTRPCSQQTAPKLAPPLRPRTHRKLNTRRKPWLNDDAMIDASFIQGFAHSCLDKTRARISRHTQTLGGRPQPKGTPLQQLQAAALKGKNTCRAGAHT